MTEFQSVDDFLKYKGSESGGGKRLKAWAKDKGYLNWWNHRKQFPCAVWYHRVPELVVRPKKDGPGELRNVWGRSHACWEDEKILKKQRFRTGSGTREHPPKACGLCRTIEAVREMIVDGTIKDTDVLFKFDGSDKPEENMVLHAGGLCSIWKRDIDEATKARLAAAGIYMGNAPGRPGIWSENMIAKLSYIFVGVDQDDVAAGVQTAVQTQSVGDKVKRAINNEIASNDGDLGNPFVNPYCIQLVYKPEEKQFDDKYDARRINRFPLTPQIDDLISGEKPDIRKYVEKFNQVALRTLLESHATRELPWKSIFDVPMPGSGDAPPPVEVPKPTTSVQVPAQLAASAPVAGQGSPTEEWGDPCDPPCNAPMKKGQTKCGKCGAVYAEVPDAGATPVATASPPTAPRSAPAGSPGMPEGVYDQGDEADVPF